MATYQHLTDGRPDGALVGAADSDKVGFFGVTPVVRPTNSAQAALTATTATSGGFGFATSANFASFIAQLENIRASLVTLGLLKGS
jgi:hypothetical protein